MAAVKSRPILHYCVVIFSGPQGSWIVCCLHLQIEFLFHQFFHWPTIGNLQTMYDGVWTYV